MNETNSIDYTIDNINIDVTDIISDIKSTQSNNKQVKIDLDELEKEFAKLKESLPKSEALKIYREYLDTEIEYIKSELEGYYPGNWDLQFDESYWNTITATLNNCFETDINRIKNSINYTTNNTLITIYILFPDITITNSRRNSRNIKDLFIRITLNPLLSSSKQVTSSYFHGWRATKYVSDIYNNYGHSHLYPHSIEYATSDPFGHFCLGNSEIASTSAILMHSYNQDTFSLILQQISSYVKWESLEGGPYRKIAEINGSSRRSPRAYSNTEINNIYKKFLEKFDSNIPYTILNTGAIDLYTISDNDEFKNMLKQVCDTRDLVYEESNGNQYEITAGSGYSASHYNTSQNTRERFKFKGESVRFKCIEDLGTSSTPPDKVNRYLSEAIKSKLEQALNNIIIDEYCNNNSK